MAYTKTQVDESVRIATEPYIVSLYLPTPQTGVVLSGSVENKLSPVVIPPTGIIPRGFDLYITPQGPATRFIGSGLGNGDSAIVQLLIHVSIEATAGSANSARFNMRTRPYTEALFTNANEIEGCFVSRKIPVNDEGALAIVAPPFIINDGDLIELSINPSAGMTININAVATTIREIIPTT